VIRKWYVCLNARGVERNLHLVRAAVASARANTDLRPICLYNGENEAHVAALAGLGAAVRRHRSSLEAELRAGYGDSFDIYSGHWLRVDIPSLEAEDELVLYTDTDVIFLAPPLLPEIPPYLAAAPEFDLDDRGYFSSGSMILNIPGMRAVQDRFLEQIRARLRGDFRWPAHDQDSFNRFFQPSLANRLAGRTFTPMPPENNWKPFWGLNPRAAVVHFHGPKPVHAQLVAAGKGARLSPRHRELFARSPEAYHRYAALWQGYHDAPLPG
jgi:hypothetical protein